MNARVNVSRTWCIIIYYELAAAVVVVGVVLLSSGKRFVDGRDSKAI